jgi:hypothetical protein
MDVLNWHNYGLMVVTIGSRTEHITGNTIMVREPPHISLVVLQNELAVVRVSDNKVFEEWQTMCFPWQYMGPAAGQWYARSM